MSTEWPNSHYISLQSLFVLTHSDILPDCVEVGSNSLDVSFCVDTLKDAIAQYGCSEIFNTELAASSHHTDQHGWRWLASRLVPILDFYNQKRRHQSLDYRTPDMVYYGHSELMKAA